MPQQQSENLQLFGLNSLTGIPFNKPVSFNEIPTVNGTGLALEGGGGGSINVNDSSLILASIVFG